MPPVAASADTLASPLARLLDLSSGTLSLGLAPGDESAGAPVGWTHEAQATAQPPLTAEEFDARTVGRTITYSAFGVPYGTEEYLPDRRVRWAFEGDSCKEGSWFPQGEQICFLYEDGTDLQCWTFHDTDDGLIAFFDGNQAEEPLVSLTESPLPLVCAGPDVGV